MLKQASQYSQNEKEPHNGPFCYFSILRRGCPEGCKRLSKNSVNSSSSLMSSSQLSVSCPFVLPMGCCEPVMISLYFVAFGSNWLTKLECLHNQTSGSGLGAISQGKMLITIILIIYTHFPKN